MKDTEIRRVRVALRPEALQKAGDEAQRRGITLGRYLEQLIKELPSGGTDEKEYPLER